LKDSNSSITATTGFSTSKLALMVFGEAFQKHLDTFVRSDKQPNNTQVIMVDPGFSRTPGMRRWFSMGSLWGLLGYLIVWPLLWLVLKSPQQGAQTFLAAAMDAELGRKPGAIFLRECRAIQPKHKEIGNDGIAKELWALTEDHITTFEKAGAQRRVRERDQAKLKTHEGPRGKGTDNVRSALVATASQESTGPGPKRR